MIFSKVFHLDALKVKHIVVSFVRDSSFYFIRMKGVTKLGLTCESFRLMGTKVVPSTLLFLLFLKLILYLEQRL